MSDFDPDWKWGHVTADGRKARIICRDANNTQPIVALITLANGQEVMESYEANGKYWDSVSNSLMDLQNALMPKRKFEFWVNVYDHIDANAHASREKADMHASINRIACVHVTCEEGEGL